MPPRTERHGPALAAYRALCDRFRSSRLLCGTVWSLLGAVAGQSLALAATVLAGRLLGTSRFGQFALLQTTIVTLGVLAGLGLGLTTNRYVAACRRTDPARAGRIITVAMVSAVLSGGATASIVAAVAGPLSSHVFGESALAGDLRVACLLLVVNAISGVQTSTLAGLEAYQDAAIATAIRGAITLPLISGGIVWGGLRGALWGSAVAGVMACGLNEWLLGRRLKSAGLSRVWKDLWSERRVLLHFSAPALLSSAVAASAGWLASVWLAAQPHGFAELGLFNAANAWRTAILFLPSTMSQPLLTALSGLHASGNTSAYRRLAGRATAAVVCVTALIAVLAAVLARPLMGIYGSAYQGAARLVGPLAAAAVLASAGMVLGQALASAEKMWVALAVNGAWALVFVGAARLLIPVYGGYGLALSHVISYSAHIVTNYLCLRVVLPPVGDRLAVES